MSHHDDITQIQVTNLFVDEMNSAGKSIGMQPLPPGTPVTKTAQTYQSALLVKLAQKWKEQYPGSDLEGNTDSGFMAPFSEEDPSVVPPCVINQVKIQWDNWQLPNGELCGEKIARTISAELLYHAGVTTFSHGEVEISPNETVAWLAGFGSFNLTNNQLGVVYTFGAALLV